MAKIKVICGSALDVKTSADIILTDPPFDFDATKLSAALDNVSCDHLILITTMKQLIELLSVSTWELSFDFVLDAVVPKKSMNIHQPNYTHATGAYLKRNGAKSLFSRKLRQRSDTFDNLGYWPSIIRAPRERLEQHGMAKNLNAMTDILGSFNVKSVCDPFAGSGTTAHAAFELDIDVTLVELNEVHCIQIEKEFRFMI